MKLNKLHINAFGNIQNKDIEFTDGINIIYGKNEAGKSTVLKFIIDSLFGISKNKRGKEFSDYDRFKPWSGDEFSGKISYTLDNQNKYEVFRDFNKKNPIIYDEQLNDISKNFTIDKTNGNQFFVEQTNIDENIFTSTLASMQQEVRLEKQDQNVLLQKLANFASAGDDNVSYKKAVEKINKRQLEDIGSQRSQGRPINVLKDEKFRLQDEIGQLEEFKDRLYEIEKEKNEFEENIKKHENDLKVLKEFKELEDEEAKKKQKIEFNKNIIENNNKKLLELKEKKENLEKDSARQYMEKTDEKGSRKSNQKYIIFAVFIALFLIISVLFRNNTPILITSILLSSLLAIGLVVYILKDKKRINMVEKKIAEEILKQTQEKQEVKNEILQIDLQIELLNKTNEEQLQDIEIQNNTLKLEIEDKKDSILEKYKCSDISYNNITYQLEKTQSEINSYKVKIRELEVDKNNVLPKLEKLSSMEEELEIIKEKEEELIKYNESIEFAKSILESAYTKMKQSVTPKFTENLSKNIDKISGGKYKNVYINDEEGIIVEKENGQYVSSEKLSVGTIDQLYISLRFGAIKEISKEKMPIILDEAFAYYDDERLENILKYINDEFKDNQLIIFTCTNRERRILEKLNIGFNTIDL